MSNYWSLSEEFISYRTQVKAFGMPQSDEVAMQINFAMLMVLGASRRGAADFPGADVDVSGDSTFRGFMFC